MTPAQSRALIAERDLEVRAFTQVVDVADPGSDSGCFPFAVKEIIDVAGLPVTYGSPLFADRVATTDAEAVRRLKAAGGVVVGMTTTTPFACGTTTVTRNPHDLCRTPGGSSAGSGAAVGAGMVPLALASQSQASTIRPASYCGAWGYKPSHLALPREGMHLLAEDLDDLGLIADSLATLEFAVEVLGDIRPLPTPETLRVGRLRLDDGGLPEPETLAALDDLCARLGVQETPSSRQETGNSAAGKSDLDEMDEALQGSGQTCFDLFAGQSAPTLEAYVRAGEPDPRLREMVDHAAAIGADGLARALARREELRAQWASLADHYDVLITLSVVNPAPLGHASTGDRRMPATASLLGVPALSAPWMTVGGLPQGAQLLGFEGRDAELLAAARLLDRRLRVD